MFKVLLFNVLVLVLLIVILPGCSKKEEKPMSHVDSLKVKMELEADYLIDKIEKSHINYNYFTVNQGRAYRYLEKEFGYHGAEIIMSLNRIDRSNLNVGDTIIVPDKIYNDRRYYSPFPVRLDEAEDVTKLLFVSQEIQAYAAYEYGTLIKWGPVSTGKEDSQTGTGLFHTNWKAEETISTFNDEWLLKWSFNISNFDGISIHEYELPGYPASHSCVRLLEQDAIWFYNWGEQWVVTPDEEKVIAYGTPVIIFGNYDFEGERPWMELPSDPDALTYSESRISSELRNFLQLILTRQIERDSVLKLNI